MIMLVTVLLFIRVTMISKRKTLRQTHQHEQPGSGDDVSGGENTGGGAGPIGASKSYT